MSSSVAASIFLRLIRGSALRISSFGRLTIVTIITPFSIGCWPGADDPPNSPARRPHDRQYAAPHLTSYKESTLAIISSKIFPFKIIVFEHLGSRFESEAALRKCCLALLVGPFEALEFGLVAIHPTALLIYYGAAVVSATA